MTGAGMSAESGISTFRDSNGLWENYRVEDVATPEGFARNPEMVLDFYNQRRRELQHAQPNAGHIGLAELEAKYDVRIITQNVDNLHERAGSTHVIHLHGELMKYCSVANLEKAYDIDPAHPDIHVGDLAPDGKVNIGGVVVEATTDGFYIKCGEGIRVVNVEGNSIGVERAE